MPLAALILGIVCGVGFLVGLVPCFGWVNWANIPLSFVGLVISIVALTQAPESEKNKCIVGIACCSVGILLGGIRLVLGAGVL
jgi:hypothetical protein